MNARIQLQHTPLQEDFFFLEHNQLALPLLNPHTAHSEESRVQIIRDLDRGLESLTSLRKGLGVVDGRSAGFGSGGSGSSSNNGSRQRSRFPGKRGRRLWRRGRRARAAW